MNFTEWHFTLLFNKKILEDITRVNLISRTESYATKLSFRLSRAFFWRVAFISL